MTRRPAWTVERIRGRADALHRLDPPHPATPTVWVFDVDTPALVLGSTQPETDVDAAALVSAGADLVRRRSGGGAVLLVPGQVVWIDVILPRGDPLWSDDVGLAFHWMGDTWATALRTLGLDPTVHKGRLMASRWSRTICFAGVGPGEVLAAGHKVVGLSQRRSRDGGRLQSVVHTRFDAGALVGVLALPPAERAAARAELEAGVSGVDAAPVAVADAFLAALPR